MKNSTLALVCVGAAMAGVLAFLIYDKSKKKLAGTAGFTTDEAIPDSGYSAGSPFPLKKGMMDNPNVSALQRFLNAEQSAGLVVDGDFGGNTEKAWLLNQVCSETPNTTGSCWKNYKAQWPNAIVAQVDSDFYNTYIKNYE